MEVNAPTALSSGKFPSTQSQSGGFGEEKNPLPPPRFEPRTVQPLTQSLYALGYAGPNVLRSQYPSHVKVSSQGAVSYYTELC
jgi:hypothetical protein